MMNIGILCTNDDGYRSKGLAASVKAALSVVGEEGKVMVCAPYSQQSACGTKTTFGKPLEYIEIEVAGVPGYAVKGTPSDAIRLVIGGLRIRPKLVISGINHGVQIGVLPVFISGTCGAAITAAGAYGVPALAIGYATNDLSLIFGEHDGSSPLDLSQYPGKQLEKIIQMAFYVGMGGAHFWNINFPEEPTDKIVFTDMVKHGFFDERVFLGEGEFCNIGTKRDAEFPKGTDAYHLRNGEITITPCVLRLTSPELIHALETEFKNFK
ncbi:hypothetical protein DRJ48_04175 [Candidatus Woesearchaeota archaeon]|nr:MAG: hypothetical protein DRJ48_04175 [Candidatus Woesearchaeota archaeon]